MTDIIQKSEIGSGGKFGNQLQEYIFGKAYATKYIRCQFRSGSQFTIISASVRTKNTDA